MSLFHKKFQPKNRTGKTVALICYLFGGVLFLLSGMRFVKYASWVQLAGLIFFCAAIYVTSIYLLREYTVSVESARGKSRYEPEEDEEDEVGENAASGDLRRAYDLVIHEHRGKRIIKVCHLSVAELTEVTAVTKDNCKEIKVSRKDKRIRKFTYNSEFLPPMQLEVRALYEGEEFSLLLPYDDELLQVLASFIKKQNESI